MFARRTTRWAAAGAALLAAGVLASAVVASRTDDGSELIAAVGEAPLTQVADIAASGGAPARGVFVQVTGTGHLCVWEAPSARSRERGGGCNTLDDPLNGQALSATLSYDGGPEAADVRSAVVFGLTAPEVARAILVMSDGSSRAIRLRPARAGEHDFKAFGYRLRRSDLERGIGPEAIVALDGTGTEMGRQQTGFGG